MMAVIRRSSPLPLLLLLLLLAVPSQAFLAPLHASSRVLSQQGRRESVAVRAEEEEGNSSFSKGEVAPGALPYAGRVAKDFVRAANPFVELPAVEGTNDLGEAVAGDLSPAAAKVLEVYAASGYGRTR